MGDALIRNTLKTLYICYYNNNFDRRVYNHWSIDKPIHEYCWRFRTAHLAVAWPIRDVGQR